MNDIKKLPLIIAKTSKEFDEIQAKLKTLPYCITAQFESVKNNYIGLECIIDTEFQDKVVVVLPDSVTQITDFGDYVGVYCKDFFLKIEKKDIVKTIDYRILKKEDMEYYLKEDAES